MKSTDLLFGQTYTIISEPSRYIVKKHNETSENKYVNGPYLSEGDKGYNSIATFGDIHEWRESTAEEKAWLEECIAAGEFIPLEKIRLLESYQIF